mmetsp:Transcript_7183/g.12108  ORF Transcript_7183/g.12108 Transcript_7183/m.12108 type:complete len:1503 (-) Transcript_7183:75-4583(-)
MTSDELREYLDEKNAFNALVRDHKYSYVQTREKDKEYRENYIKSFIHRSNFKSETLRIFKENTKFLNLNTKPVKTKTKEQSQIERLKHEQNKRASEKRGLPKFDMVMAKKLLNGKFHEEDEEEAENQQHLNNQTIYAHSNSEVKHQNQLEEFENQMMQILEQEDDDNRENEDEIPADIRRRFNLPVNMGIYQIDFNEIRKDDVSKKKIRPMWSGQDVLPDQLDHRKSVWVIEHLNNIRVWPLGLNGIVKRLRFKLRIVVKSPFFDNIMTFAVLLNTITLSVQHHGQSEATTVILDTFNSYFTWIFIFEMTSKLLAIGVSKYCAERMNYLDGGVVMLSVVELLSDALLDNQNVSLSAFKTVRMFRTFRVFRVARLLRALQSMQTILGVMSRSYKSFIYITMLMFLFIFIYALLGMSLFGGKFDYDDGTPRGNYDTFPIAIITVFQVLTMENWQTVLFDSMRGNTNKFFISIFYISWIFIGNFILLNLFLAILLDSFLEEDEEEEDEEALAQFNKQKRMRALEKKRRKDVNKVFMNLQLIRDINNHQASKFYFGQAKGESEEDLEDLDEEQIIKIFKQQGILKKDEDEVKQQQLFIGVECASAFYIFSKDNCLRVACYKITKHPLWDNSVIAMILLSSLKLAMDTFTIESEVVDIPEISKNIDLFFNYAFLFEMLTKLVALGLCMDEGSYLRDSWNQLDFFIVISSIIDTGLPDVDLPVIKILRMLRTLRPLRFISHNPELKMVVVSLLESVGHIVNVLIVVAVVYLIFAILGVNFFGGAFFYCSEDIFVLHTELECVTAGGEWKRFDQNFDDAKQAMLTLYVVSSLEGWPDTMLQGVDMVGTNQGPSKENTKESMIYFAAFILIGSFFFLNFFIGVLFLKFNQAQREEQQGFSAKDLGWMDIQRLILTASPEYESTNVPKSERRKKFHRLVSSPEFDVIIMTCILLNMLQMACLHENMSGSFEQFLRFTNYIFTTVFIVEGYLKLVAFGKSYFYNSWNRFDFFVVISSIFDLLLEQMENSSLDFLSVGPQLARVMRVLRVTRVLRLAGKAEGLQAILQTIQFSIPSLVNVFMLLMLIFFMFSILGNYLFQEVIVGDVIDEWKNFGNFLNSFLLLFALSTGEDWNKIMFDVGRTEVDNCIPNETCGSSWSYLYFMILVLVCTHVMLNLFILVIIQQFEKYYLPKENMITLFKNDQQAFMQVWKEFTQDRYNCLKIKENQLTKFFRRLGDFGDKQTSLGFNEEYYEDGELKKQLLKMAIKSDNGYIYFNELLYRCMRRKYGNMKINKKMQIFELRTQYSIYLMTLRIQKSSKAITKEDIFKSIIKKENGVNPFLLVMNFKISFKTWLKFARIQLRKKEKGLLTDARHITDNSTSLMEDEKPKLCEVEIEVEQQFSETSEEDSQPEPSAYTQFHKRNKTSVSLTGSAPGSIADLHQSKSMRDGRKKIDPLQLFERKITQRFHAQLMASKQGITPSHEGNSQTNRSKKSASMMQSGKSMRPTKSQRV